MRGIGEGLTRGAGTAENGNEVLDKEECSEQRDERVLCSNRFKVLS